MSNQEFKNQQVPNSGMIDYYDPNDGDPVNIEDLSMFVDLRVRIPNRDRRENKIREDYIIGGSKRQDGEYLTTDYVEMSFTDIKNGAINNRELLGVESIDISFDPHFFPLVTMRIVDIRGLSLMQPKEARYYQSCGGKEDVNKAAEVFFQSLFDFPYPTFTLTVKGYYGPMVSFELKVTDFKSTFDSRSGNFVCTVKFVGSMYGDLTEIPASYVLSAPYIGGSNGKPGSVWNEYVKEKGVELDGGTQMPTIVELLDKYNNFQKMSADDFNSVMGDETEALKTLQEIHDLKSQISVLEDVHAKIRGYNQSLKDNGIIIKDDKGRVWSYIANNKDAIYRTYKVLKGNVGEVEKSDYYAKFDDATKNYLNSIKNDEDNVNKNEYTCDTDGGAINIFRGEKTTANLIQNTPSMVNNNDVISGHIPSYSSIVDGYVTPFLTKSYSEIVSDKTIYDNEDVVKKLCKNLNEKKCYKLPYYGDIEAKLNEIIQKQTDTVRKKEGESYSSAEMLFSSLMGFKPTFKNIYKILYAHLYVLIQHIVYCDDEITNRMSTRKKDDLSDGLYIFDGRTTSGAKQDDKVRAFPTINKKVDGKTEFAYPEEYEKFAKEPECNLVNRVFKGVTGMAKNVEEMLSSYNTPTEDTSATVKTNFEATFPTDYFLDWEGGGPYDMAFEKCNLDNTTDCAEELLCMYLLRLTRVVNTFNSHDKLAEIQKKEAKNLISANFVGVDSNKKLEILQELAYMCEDGDIEKIFEKRMGHPLSYYLTGEFCKKIPVSDANSDSIIKDGKLAIVRNTEAIKGDLDNNNFSNVYCGVYVIDGYGGYNYKGYKNQYGIHISPNKATNIERKISGPVSNEEHTNPIPTLNITNLLSNTEEIYTINNIEDGDFNNTVKRKLLLFNLLFTKNTIAKNPKDYEEGDTKGLIVYDRPKTSTNSDFFTHWLKCSLDIEGVYWVNLFEILKIGAYYWYENNIAGHTVNIIKEGKTYRGIFKGEYPFYIKKIIGGKKEFFLPSMYASTYDEKCNELCFLQNLSYLFERWAEGTDIVEIDNGIKTYGFDYFFNIDKNGNIGANTTLTYENMDNDKNPFIMDVILPYIEAYRDETSTLKKNEKFKDNVINNGFRRTLLGNEAIRGYSSYQTMEEENDSNHAQRMNIYYSLKHIYERFVLTTSDGKYNLTKDNNVFNDVEYVDAFMNDVSDKLMVSFDAIMGILSRYITADKSPSFFELLAEIAQSNNMQFLTLPMLTLRESKDIFKITKWWEDYEVSRNTFVVLNPGKSSEYLDTPDNEMNDYLDDGYNIEKDIANNFGGGTTDAPLSVKAKAFGVTYGIQNQNYFRSISVGMEKPTETAESLSNQVLLSQTGKEGGIYERLRPVDLFNIYSNRSYDCTVEMMGDMGIMPLMYFQLNNVPMFRGVYMITNVTHRITARDFSTTFKGTRQSKFATPLPENAFIINNMMDLVSKANDKTKQIKENDAKNVKDENIIQGIWNKIKEVKFTNEMDSDNKNDLVEYIKNNSTTSGDGLTRLAECDTKILKDLCNILSCSNEYFGNKRIITVTSSKRDGDENVSQHNKGFAVDIQINKHNGKKDYDANFKLFAICCKVLGDDFNQLIWENNHDDTTFEMPRWIHIGATDGNKNKHQKFALNASTNKQHTPSNLTLLMDIMG